MQTLVLNVGYQPIGRVRWERAITWIVGRAVEVIDEYPDRYIRTPNWRVRMPSIVRLLKATPRPRGIKFSRQNVYTRDRGRCQYCGVHVRRDEFTYEHVVPRVLGGRTAWDNIVVACMPCNQRKAGRTPRQAGMQLLSTPARPRSLPTVVPGLAWAKEMPESWRSFLRNAVYWDGELDSDGEA